MNGPNRHNGKYSKELIGEIQIVVAVLFFGVSFVFQRYAMLQGIGPITYNACRYIVSTILLLVFRPYGQSILHSELKKPDGKQSNSCVELKELWWWGSLTGISGLFGSLLQQIGIVTVTAGKTGFITGMFVIFVPIVEWITPGFGGSLTYKSWIAAVVSLIGLYLLSGCAESAVCLGGAVGSGEVIVFISMLFWVLSIMWSDIGAKRVDVISLTTVDFSITTVFTVVLALIFEPSFWRYPFPAITANWQAIVIVGFTESVAFTLSTLGQMYTPPTRASVLFSMEAVVCAIISYFALQERLTLVEVAGCCLMFGSAVASSVFSESEEASETVTSLGDGAKGLEVEMAPFLRSQPVFGSLDLVEAAQR